jgi:hypothetical protein
VASLAGFFPRIFFHPSQCVKAICFAFILIDELEDSFCKISPEIAGSSLSYSNYLDACFFNPNFTVGTLPFG